MRPRLSPVLAGITLVYIGLALTLLCIIGIFVLPYVLKDFRTLFQILEILAYTAIAASVLSLAGKLLCLAAPADMPGKWAIFLAIPFLLFSAVVVTATTFRLAPLLRVMPQTPHLGEYALMASLVGFGFFLIFLKNLAGYLDSPDNVRLAVVTMVVGGLVLAIYLFGRFLLFDVILQNPMRSQEIFRGFAITLVLFVGGFVMCYGRLLTYLRSEIKDVMGLRGE